MKFIRRREFWITLTAVEDWFMLSSNCLGKERLHFIKTSRKCSASIPENLNRHRTIYLHYKKILSFCRLICSFVTYLNGEVMTVCLFVIISIHWACCQGTPVCFGVFFFFLIFKSFFFFFLRGFFLEYQENKKKKKSFRCMSSLTQWV